MVKFKPKIRLEAQTLVKNKEILKTLSVGFHFLSYFLLYIAFSGLIVSLLDWKVLLTRV